MVRFEILNKGENMISIRLEAFKLLSQRSVSVKIKMIAEKTGLPVDWLKSFAVNGSTMDSSSDRVQALYEYLSGKSLI